MALIKVIHAWRSQLTLKPGFHMVVKMELRSFSSAEIRHFRTENTRCDYK